MTNQKDIPIEKWLHESNKEQLIEGAEYLLKDEKYLLDQAARYEENPSTQWIAEKVRKSSAWSGRYARLALAKVEGEK